MFSLTQHVCNLSMTMANQSGLRQYMPTHESKVSWTCSDIIAIRELQIRCGRINKWLREGYERSSARRLIHTTRETCLYFLLCSFEWCIYLLLIGNATSVLIRDITTLVAGTYSKSTREHPINRYSRGWQLPHSCSSAYLLGDGIWISLTMSVLTLNIL